MKIIKFLVAILLVCGLTVITQVGGVVFIISLFTFGQINKKLSHFWFRFTAKLITFVSLYLVFIFIIIPPIASRLGRVPLTMAEINNVRPANILTVLLNRNYVKRELKQVTFDVARKMNDKYPGTVLNYLDANFPFIDDFPLLPHLSHDDGRKLDLSFFYIDTESGKSTDRIPSWIGYGVSEGPKKGEFDRPAECRKKGFWQYSYMSQKISQKNKKIFQFDEKRTTDLVNYFAADEGIRKILIEPHLKTRLGLTNNKIRLHGCNSVRHDDHIHIELK